MRVAALCCLLLLACQTREERREEDARLVAAVRTYIAGAGLANGFTPPSCYVRYRDAECTVINLATGVRVAARCRPSNVIGDKDAVRCGTTLPLDQRNAMCTHRNVFGDPLCND